MTPAYDARRSDWFIVALALASVCGTRIAGTFVTIPPRFGYVLVLTVVVIIVVAKKVLRPRRFVMLLLVVIVTAVCAVNGARALHELRNVTVGPYSGLARVVSDPQRSGAATRIILDISGDRFVVYAYGPPAWRLEQASAGEQVIVAGQRSRLSPIQSQRWMSRHIKGRFDIETVQERRFAASPLFRSAQRVRELIDRGAASFPADERSLFTGLVIGDDRRQPEQMISAFRKSGLAHLVAVSGQNVAFVLAGLAPLLRRLTTPLRTYVICGVLVWFVVITRIESSVVRAAVMAGIATLATTLGRPTRTIRLLALTVLLTVFSDPLLAWSVGYFMSVGATAGLCLGAAPLARLIPGPRWFAVLVGATVSAQLGVAPAVTLVFGLPPAIGIVTNVLAVPVASLVMLFGLPLSLLSGLLSGLSTGALGETIFAPVSRLLMWPVLAAVRWVWWIAALGERLNSAGIINLALWLVVIAVLGLCAHRSWHYNTEVRE